MLGGGQGGCLVSDGVWWGVGQGSLPVERGEVLGIIVTN